MSAALDIPADSVRTEHLKQASDLRFSSQSDVEAELHDVAVGHDVVLALDPHPTAGLRLCHRPGLHQLVEADDLGLDEPTLEVGVDDARGLRGGGADRDRP